jgi:hypothetical protein
MIAPAFGGKKHRRQVFKCAPPDTRKPPECCALQLFDRITSHHRSPLAATNQLLLKKGLCKRSIVFPVPGRKTDPARSCSHQLAAADSASMFLPTRTCWDALQKALAKHAKAEGNKYILGVDVANFFGSLNLHTLINVLNDSGYPRHCAPGSRPF